MRVNRAIDTMLAQQHKKLQQQENLLQRYSEKMDEVMNFWMRTNAGLNEELEKMKEYQTLTHDYAFKMYSQAREVLLNLSKKRLSKIRKEFPDLYALLNIDETLEGDSDTDGETDEL